MLQDDIIINKISSINRCIERAKEEFCEDFLENFSKQDAAILNIVRACEQAIDLANHLVRKLDLGIPNETRDSFSFLNRAKIIDRNLAENLEKMVGFRNLVIHEYQRINIQIVIDVINKRLPDLKNFCEIILKLNK